MVGGRTYLGQSNFTLSDVVMSPSMLWDTLRKLTAGWFGSSWNFPVPKTEKRSSARSCFVIRKYSSGDISKLHTSEFLERELHFRLVRWTTTRELSFYFHFLQLQMKYFFLQGLLEPGASLLIWTKVGNGEADRDAQHRGVNGQWHVAVGGCVGVVKKNLCEGFVLSNIFRKPVSRNAHQ